MKRFVGSLAKSWKMHAPVEHSENLKDQEYAVDRFEALRKTAAGPCVEIAEGYLDFDRRHHRVVKKYGRFPDRNDVFGRKSTPEEIQFLASDEAPF
jgi:uncharacterized protein (DUF924 family)